MLLNNILENSHMPEKWDGLTKFKNINRSWKCCPRCNKATINKDLRKCVECNGHICFYGDDALIEHYNKYLIHWFMWYKSPFTTFYGWYDKSYFVQEGITKGLI